jgi:hypothetical protein
MRKRDLLTENRRLAAELSYLRGRMEEMSKAPAEVVGYVREIVTDTFGLFNHPMPGPVDVQMYDQAHEPTAMYDTADWTDQLAPKTHRGDPTLPPSPELTVEDLDRMAEEWNDRLVIADELDRDP